jgi:hypothetical protein
VPGPGRCPCAAPCGVAEGTGPLPRVDGARLWSGGTSADMQGCGEVVGTLAPPD